MYPFYNNPLVFAPFGFPPFFPARRRYNVPRLDVRGIPFISTTDIVEDTESEEGGVTYGINPCEWNALPCRTVILWKVDHPVSQNGADLPVSVAVPGGSRSSTVASSGSVSGTKKVPVVDNKSTQVSGRDVTVPTGSGSSSPVQTSYTTEHWVYIDKGAGIFRLLGVTSQNSPARSSGSSNTPVESQAAVKGK